MRKTLLAFVYLMCALPGLQSCSSKPQYAAIAQGTVVLAFGDSVTRGVGAGQGEDYPTELAALTGWDVQNYGISGDTAAAAKGRIAEALEETEPGLVIVELGGNDFLRRFPPARVKEDLREILRAAKAGGRPVALVAVPEFSLLGAPVGSLSDAPLYRALAAEEEVVLVAEVFSDILSTPELKADRIHPNREGYAVLARGIAQVLQDVGLAKAR
jgi:acyl-CoA hydrolase